MNNWIQTVLVLAYIICCGTAVAYGILVIVAAFSTKVQKWMRRQPVAHALLRCLAFVGILFFLGILNVNMWPPLFVERRGQEATVVERIQSAGGWPALQKDCEALAENHPDSGFQWVRGFDTNELPRSIIALNPQEVRFDSPEALRDFPDGPKVPVIQIKIFGLHATGGHSTPYFGLQVVCDTNAMSYRPLPGNGGASGNQHNSYRRVTDTIYEIF